MRKVNLNNPVPPELHLDYCDKYIVLLDNVPQIRHTQECVLNESYILMVVEKGTCRTIVNGNESNLEKGDIFICAPGNILSRGTVSTDFHCQIFIISAEYVGEILKGTRMSITHYLKTNVVEVLHLTPEEQRLIKEYYGVISAFSGIPSDDTREQSIHRILQSFAYSFAGFFLHRGFVQKHDRGTAAESLFRSFAHMLHEHPCGRTVQFYAGKLCITPKYFNAICKQVAGKTASTLINEEVVKRAQIMLKDPNMSIKQIASSLGFSNQSHFGSFIRKETGVSPQTLRKQWLATQ